MININPAHGMFSLQISAGKWHNLEVIEPAVLFEAKDGPYQPLTPEDTL
jgi:hypothetical protein